MYVGMLFTFELSGSTVKHDAQSLSIWNSSTVPSGYCWLDCQSHTSLCF